MPDSLNPWPTHKGIMATPVHHLLRLTLALILLLSITAESSWAGQVQSSGITVTGSDVTIIATDPYSSDATCLLSQEPALIIGDNEEDENHWFTSFRGMGRLSDGSVVAVDRGTAEVRVFDDTGQFIRSMGRRGNGPGEFGDAFILWVTGGDTLWVGDTRPWRYNVFTAQGDFVRQVRLDPEYLNPSRGGGVLDNGYSVNAWEKSEHVRDFSSPDSLIVEFHDPNGKLVTVLDRIPNGTMGSIKNGPPNFVMGHLFEARAEIDALGSTIVLAHGDTPELKVLDQALNLRMIMRWDEPARKVTGSDIRAWRGELTESRGELDEYDEALMSRDRPVADEFPVMSSVRIGRDGRIWVRRYDRPREDLGWFAFSPDGEFVCHMAPMPGAVWEFGADYVLLLHRSESGPDTVRMYRLVAP